MKVRGCLVLLSVGKVVTRELLLLVCLLLIDGLIIIYNICIAPYNTIL